MSIVLTGSIPGLINENTPLWDWMGQLRLVGNPADIRFVDLIGFGSNFFDATLNQSTGMIAITPISVADYEWFSSNHLSPTLDFSVRFFMMDGTIETSQSSYAVTVLNIDDTAPQSLGFATGGSVEAGKAGAAIGNLAVLDPDTSSGFTYTVREDDQWMFEVVDNILKLRSGISLSVNDGPTRPVVIDVSDGTHSSAFTLDITITMPGSSSVHGVDIFESHERSDGFYWKSATVMAGDHMSYEIASLRHQGAYETLTMRDGQSLVFKAPDVLQLLDGTVYYSGNSKAAWIWSAYETVLGREPHNYEMWQADRTVDNSVAPADFINGLLGSAEYQQKYGSLDNIHLVERFYLNTSGTISAGGTAYHAGHLDAGYTRATVVQNFIDFRKDLGQTEARADQGIFVAKAYVQQAEILINVGAGYAPSSDTGWWGNAVAAGQATMSALANGIMGLPGYAQHMGALDTRGFVTQFFAGAVGFAPDVATVDAFTSAIDSGGYTRAQYMEAVAWGVTLTDSYVYQRPDGAAFANPW
ncbi:MAG: hypothetical protein JWR10_641 [Rubritepida sp.]|nr:hypothetical protein [Rubritepida sp.]